MTRKPTFTKRSAASMDRSVFIAGAASLATIALPASAEAVTAPPIYANGVQDDAPGIQWRLDRGISVHIDGQTLLFKSPVCVRNRSACLSLTNTEVRSCSDDKSVLVKRRATLGRLGPPRRS